VAHVLIYSLVFPPDGVSTAQLYGELAEDLQMAGHHVSVITTAPHYNCDSVAVATQPLRRIPRWGGMLLESDFHGIRVIHTAMPVGSRINFTRRLYGWLGFHLLGLIAAVRMVGRPQVILVPSPLLTAGIVAWILGVLRGSRYIYNVQELYPDLAIEIGRLSNPLVIRLLRALERAVYRTASATTGISRQICEQLLERIVAPEKVHHIPNFVDLKDLSPGSKDNTFAREFDLVDKFIIGYAGNLGLAQDLDTLLDAAASMQCQPDLKFILVGDGVHKLHLQRRVHAEGLTNVLFVGHQPYSLIPEIYAASDVCLVPLAGGVSGSALPSKLLRIMACGRPVLAVCDSASEIGQLVREANAGIIVTPGDTDGLARAILFLRTDDQRRNKMAADARRFVAARYSRSVITAAYSHLISELAK
jgi:colanic acid biosynthesis glycosyl transferase WcaI